MFISIEIIREKSKKGIIKSKHSELLTFNTSLQGDPAKLAECIFKYFKNLEGQQTQFAKEN